MEKKIKSEHPYLRMIADRKPIIFDGATGTEIQKAEPSKKDYGDYNGCNEYLNISRPDIIENIHIKYLEAGAHAIETNTFGASRVKLNEFKLGDRVYEINRAAAQIARRAIEKIGANDKRPRFVCASIGPTGFLPSSSDKELSAITFDELVDIYKEQAAGLIDGGADVMLVETSQDLIEVRAAIIGIREATKNADRYVPIQVQITMDASGKMLLGSDISAFLGAVQGMGVDVVGLNCSSGPDEMSACIEELLKLSNIPVSMLPNAGLPSNVDGKAVYKMGAQEFAKKVSAFVVFKGVSVVGGCCGTTPEHIKSLAEMLVNAECGMRNAEHVYLGDSQFKNNEEFGNGLLMQEAQADLKSKQGVAVHSAFRIPHSALDCWLSTGITGANLERLAKPIIIGERLNAQGSKKTKEFILSRNYDELYHIAEEQIAHKCNLIDISVAANELDISEAEMMSNVISFLSDRVTVPFCVDTTELATLESALKKSSGAVLINSINLEHGGARARTFLKLAVEFGCPVIALTIDDFGMATTAKRKVAIAAALKNLACDEFGLPEHFLYIDPLVFTLATGDADTANAANESLTALRMIKEEFPNIRTVMGVSNVSFGLKPKARRVLNNLMLHHAVIAGLDAAIFNPLHVDDVNKYDNEIRELADDLLLNRRNDALMRYVECFENAECGPCLSRRSEAKPMRNAELTSKSKTIDGNDNRQVPEQQLHDAVLNRDKRNLSDIINTLLKNQNATDILNKILLPAMAEVGDRMASGDMILPFVLQAAEVMKSAMTILEPHLKDGGGSLKGKIVIATVYGDVHDIGKNLVASILRNQGFDVIDLGKQVSVETIVETIKNEKPDILGLSALLVTTSQEMDKCVKTFAKLGLDTPIVIGGAAVNKDFAERISTLDNGAKYEGGVYYAKDAFDLAKIFDTISANDLSAKNSLTQSNKKSANASLKTNENRRENIKYDYFIEPPFFGTGDILTWDIPALLSSIDREFLFKAWWGGGKLSTHDYSKVCKEEFEPALKRLSVEITDDALIDARALYGFFPAITENEKIIILDPSDNSTEKLSFVFPRSEKSGLSLADYIRPESDVICAQAVTIGAKLCERCRSYFLDHDRYSTGFYLNALGNYLTELLADKVSNEIRRALGLPKNSGRRYSFGYPGMPDLSEQPRLLEYLGVEERLGITLTDGFQMQPEHSTAAIFILHPNAEYFV